MDCETRNGELIDRLDFEAMDAPEELLAEAAGIGVLQAQRALAWMRDQGEQQHDHDTADALLRLLALLIPQAQMLDGFVIGLRACALRWLLRPEGETMTALARRLEISKQLLSFHVRSMEKITGVHSAAQKSPHTRASYAESARQRWGMLDANQRRARRNSATYRRQLAEIAAQSGMPLDEVEKIPA